MAKDNQAAIDLFKRKAELASIKVLEMAGMTEALAYAVETCDKQDFCRLLLPDESGQLRPEARSTQKTLAAPGLDEADFQSLAELGRARGFKIIREGLRDHLAGIELALTKGEMGIAATATSLMACPGEDLRLAAMVCETHVLALPRSRVVADSYEVEDYLRSLLAEEAMYAAFISGPSRTADIERVLTLGVHGPLELHVLLLADDQPENTAPQPN